MYITKERKYILIIGAVMLLLGVIYRFYPDLTDFFLVEDEVIIKENQILKFQKVAAARQSLLREIKLLEKNLEALEGRLLSGRTSSLAAVELQELIKDAGRNAEDVDIDTMRVMSSKKPEESDYTRIPVRFTINSDIRQLKDLIYHLESGKKFLIVQELRMDSQEQSTPGRIRTTMTVEGIIKE